MRFALVWRKEGFSDKRGEKTQGAAAARKDMKK